MSADWRHVEDGSPRPVDLEHAYGKNGGAVYCRRSAGLAVCFLSAIGAQHTDRELFGTWSARTRVSPEATLSQRPRAA